MPVELMTEQGNALLTSCDTPWNVYPRPQMKRDSFLNLNGFWEFSAGELYADRFRVPFCPESRLSNIATHFPEGTPLAYRRCFVLPEGFHKAGCFCTSVLPIKLQRSPSMAKKSAAMWAVMNPFPLISPMR